MFTATAAVTSVQKHFYMASHYKMAEAILSSSSILTHIADFTLSLQNATGMAYFLKS